MTTLIVLFCLVSLAIALPVLVKGGNGGTTNVDLMAGDEGED